MRRIRGLGMWAIALVLGSLLAAPVTPAAALAPESSAAPDTPMSERVVAANPLAARAGLQMLEAGGNAVDAAVAVQMALGVVEPQSSGLGGGALILWWDQRKQRLESIDGLSQAPHRLPTGAMKRSGKATIGVPGALRALADLHARAGYLPWGKLFAPAISLAEDGFPMPAYLHRVLGGKDAAAQYGDIFAMYAGPDGRLLDIGTTVRNPKLAATLRAIAATGADAFYNGALAQSLAVATSGAEEGGGLTLDDLRSYHAVARQPICAPFLDYQICAAPPPSYGGLAVLQILDMLQAQKGATSDFADPQFLHLFIEASRLAQADRQAYVGDPDFIAVPVDGLLQADYLEARAGLIHADAALPIAKAGEPRGKPAGLAPDTGSPSPGTSQVVVVDRQGNALTMTTTINLNFGSRILVDGYVLNDVLTNFARPSPDGAHKANEPAPGKRPVTSMAPVVVFDREHRPVVLGGSAGGGEIVGYVAESLVDLLARGATPSHALSLGHVSAPASDRRDGVELEAGTPTAGLANELTGLGHVIELHTMPSGLGFAKRVPGGWIGAADPRRDGVALGE